MQSRLYLFLVCAAAFTIPSTALYGQTPIGVSQGLYCTTGLHPDGYIDFSGLPAAPNMIPLPGMSNQPSAAVSATLPVRGVQGLTVSVTIPPLNSSAGAPTAAYTVDGGTLQLNGLPSYSSSPPATVLTLNFSKPIVGLGLNTETVGRFEYTYNLQVGESFLASASGFTFDMLNPQTQSLQAVGLNQTVFNSANIQFAGDEYYAIALSNFRVQSASAPDPAGVVPANGLEQWLRADTAAASGPFGDSVWRDQSGNGHDAAPSANAPFLAVDGRNCQAAFQFTGDRYFSFNLPIAGWSEMTIFLVSRAGNDAGSYTNNTAIRWAQNQAWGDTFVSPYQTHIYARFGTTQTFNNLYYTRPGGGVGQDFTTTRLVHDHGADSLFVNGLSVQSRPGKLPVLGGAAGAATIGQGFDGEISEVLVYNRVLSAEEAWLVENYLRQKYGTP